MLKFIRDSKFAFYWFLIHHWCVSKLFHRQFPPLDIGVDTGAVSLKDLDGKRVHFWVPHQTAGAQFILWDVVPFVIDSLLRKCPRANISISESIPKERFDVVLSFKEPIPDWVDTRHRCLVICDEIDRLWRHLATFDSAVCTSSLALASLLKKRVNKVYWISEVEPDDLIAHGSSRLGSRLLGPCNSIFWHGGNYTLNELADLKPFFEMLRERIHFESIEVVCGDGEYLPTQLRKSWINCHPWSRENLKSISARCRLAILPARRSLRNSFLKPASRLRCCFAMGLPAIGDDRVPEVVLLSRQLGLPVLDFRDIDRSVECVADLWTHPERLEAVAVSGHSLIRTKYSRDFALEGWEQTLSRIAASCD